MKLGFIETDVLPVPVADVALKITCDETIYPHAEPVLAMLIAAGLQFYLFDVLLLDRCALRVHGQLDGVQRIIQQNVV